MSDMQIQNVLQQMRALSQSGRVEGSMPATQQPTAPSEGGEFATALRDSLRSVNALQQEAKQVQTRFELGEANTSLPQVMVAMNKSSLAFEATNQVRNRLLSAYQEVMSMQV
ncbi:flagellar hook-basal body complex protein FliE [Marichromatium sp. AB31]|uniref:flagellar hook-basal body complex protein FliE n=1 Tax=Marichromatium sp. AB31 TaxID=2483362 RepID=UPI000F3ABCA6|nr:flagellar hook-basal body complex protein FliE [Marichromatium sp. AB31]RNE89671.1 flagellar hook-basal body complex protein FliE [Marichromatium sp. AB31]